MAVGSLNTLNAGSSRAIAAACCIVASAAIFVHHSAPSMDMPGMSSIETCVSVAAHAVETPVASATLLATLVGAVVLFSQFLGSRLQPTRPGRARAGPSELRVPLRC
ncbi:MAG TPA: hypothetical protein VGO31_04955 [Microbacteriaceae bacterium]|nr:hypothetical protein [Microbacteriaceae bacterium]